jgi:hypothetical protein
MAEQELENQRQSVLDKKLKKAQGIRETNTAQKQGHNDVSIDSARQES